MMHDCDRLTSVFTEDRAVRMPHIDAEAVSRSEIRAGIERLQGSCELLRVNHAPGAIQLDGDAASARAYICELGRFLDGTSRLSYAVYHDRYQRTPDGWKFAERVYEVRYLDTTALRGFRVPRSVDAREPADGERSSRMSGWRLVDGSPEHDERRQS